MINYVIKLEDAFVHNFTNIDMLQGIGNHLMEILMAERFDIPCNDFPKVFLLRLFIRMRIYYTLKYANRKLASSKRKNRKYIKVVHL